jgi:23S rRNA maturation-related 3'-5' exoribonuclease YhaM
LKTVPKYFEEVPASSTGKYHPAYALGKGGLYRHVQAALKIAVELFPIYEFPPLSKDIILAALMLHDCWKQGDLDTYPDSKLTKVHTVHEHPMIAGKKIRASSLPETISQMIALAVESHMGQWRTNQYSAVVLPAPETEIQKFVHLCDYLASRRSLEVIL